MPDLSERIQQLDDPRYRKEYKIAELITAGIMMYLFKEGSRNAMNNSRKEDIFRKNYSRVFKMQLPHMDTVEDLLRELKQDELERLKATLVSGLITQKIFDKFKFLGKRYIIAIDGSGMDNVGTDKEGAVHKEYKNGDIIYYYYVLEAKLVTSNGFSISIASEWISNEGKNEYDKQDCEQQGFKRIAVKIKEYFPRLSICITADGLYPNQTFFKICKENGWWFIVTLQDGNLKSVQEEIRLLPGSGKSHSEIYQANKTKRIKQSYTWMNGIDYKGYLLNWIECKETVTDIKTSEITEKRFVHITDVVIDKNIAHLISFTGRMRWKIENEGFNSQKNLGYELEHDYSRVSFLAIKNYYQCLQIAHMINQLVILSKAIQEFFYEDSKLTIKHLWKLLHGMFTHIELQEDELYELVKKRYQIRLA
jgi:hypothetical protein